MNQECAFFDRFGFSVGACGLGMLVVLVSSFCLTIDVQAQTKNGFDLSRASISPDDMIAGGPPRDGIPSIDHPKFIAVKDAHFLKDDDIVIGFTHGKTTRAYPTRILVWHEIVNDVIEGRPIAVTYCPLCGTAMVFERNIGGKERTLGVSGLLYQSDVLMYDRETESLWSQLAMKAVSGPAVDTPLTWLPSEHSTWQAWRAKYPRGEVLSTDTGYQRRYRGTAYASYFASDDTMFPVPHRRREFANKAWVIGVIIEGKAKAYPVEALPHDVTVKDSIGNNSIAIQYDPETRHPTITNARGEPVPSVMVFWFAWQAFYPTTDIWTP